MSGAPRVAFFTDTFHEANGVARTSRNLEAFARRRKLPMLSVRCGREERFERDGELRTFQVRRCRAAFRLEHDLRHDAFLWRYAGRLRRALERFAPQVIHITSPGDVGALGAWFAWRMKLPLAAAWTTNLHSFAARRVDKLASLAPAGARAFAAEQAERWSLRAVLRFYRAASLVFVPTDELAAWLTPHLCRPPVLMRRGVDADAFNPKWRDRADDVFTFGFVGRLSPEKNVRFLRRVERHLIERGHRSFRFLIVGDGGERRWLERNMQRAELTGVLTGEPLSRAFANTDLFVFPSRTETFGNVVLEAFASGVPAVVTDGGGPKHIVRPGVTGVVARNDDDFLDAVDALVRQPEKASSMGLAARRFAGTQSWDRIFEQVWDAYSLRIDALRRRSAGPSPASRGAHATG